MPKNYLQPLLNENRGKTGLTDRLMRGDNVYNATSKAAHRGGGQQYGRPKDKNPSREAIQRRLQRSKK